MTEQQVIELIQKEFKEKTLGVTKQYLEIHSPIYADNKLKIETANVDLKDIEKYWDRKINGGKRLVVLI